MKVIGALTTKEACFKLHGKEKTLNCLVELKGQPSRKTYQANSYFENSSKTSSFSSIEEGMLALRAEIECLKSLMDSIRKPPFGTCFLSMIGNNSNSFFNVFKTLC